MRKNANEGKGDAVFNGLEYKPVSVMMPVPEKDDQPLWMWLVRLLRACCSCVPERHLSWE